MSSARKDRYVVGAGVAACAVCCAPPVLGLVGIAGVGAAATVATVAFAGLAFALVILLATLGTAVARRRRVSHRCATTRSAVINAKGPSPRSGGDGPCRQCVSSRSPAGGIPGTG